MTMLAFFESIIMQLNEYELHERGKRLSFWGGSWRKLFQLFWISVHGVLTLAAVPKAQGLPCLLI